MYKFQPQIQVASCCWVENLKWGRKRKKIRVILEAGPWTECELSTALPLVRYPCKSTLFIYLFFFQMTSSHNFEILSEPHKIKYPKRVARCSDGPKKGNGSTKICGFDFLNFFMIKPIVPFVAESRKEQFPMVFKLQLQYPRHYNRQTAHHIQFDFPPFFYYLIHGSLSCSEDTYIFLCMFVCVIMH